MMPSPVKSQHNPRPRLSSNLSDNELVEALKVANYADTVRQLDNFYGQG